MQGCLIEAHDEHSRSLVGVAQLVILTDSLFEFFEDFTFLFMGMNVLLACLSAKCARRGCQILWK